MNDSFAQYAAPAIPESVLVDGGCGQAFKFGEGPVDPANIIFPIIEYGSKIRSFAELGDDRKYEIASALSRQIGVPCAIVFVLDEMHARYDIEQIADALNSGVAQGKTRPAPGLVTRGRSLMRQMLG